MEADVTADKNTCERTEGAAAAIQVKHEDDSCSAKGVQAGPTSSTSFGMKAEPPALLRWDDVLVDKDAAAQKSSRSPVEIRPRTTAGGLLPAGKASTATRIIYFQSHLWFCSTKETNSERASIQNASYYSSFWDINSQQAPF